MDKLKAKTEAIKNSIENEIKSSGQFSADQQAIINASLERSLGDFTIPDTKVYLIAVGSLAATIIMCIMSTFFLAYNEVEMPEVLSVIAGAAIGALAGMISSKG